MNKLCPDTSSDSVRRIGNPEYDHTLTIRFQMVKTISIKVTSIHKVASDEIPDSKRPPGIAFLVISSPLR